MPLVRRSQGAGKALVLAPARPRRAGGVDSGLPDGLRPRTKDGLVLGEGAVVLGEGAGWRSGLLSQAGNQNRAHEGQPTGAPCKEPQLLVHPPELSLPALWGLRAQTARSSALPFASMPEAS